MQLDYDKAMADNQLSCGVQNQATRAELNHVAQVKFK